MRRREIGIFLRSSIVRSFPGTMSVNLLRSLDAFSLFPVESRRFLLFSLFSLAKQKRDHKSCLLSSLPSSHRLLARTDLPVILFTQSNNEQLHFLVESNFQPLNGTRRRREVDEGNHIAKA